MELLFLILLLASPFLLLATYLMTAKSTSFWKIFTAHTIALIVYLTFVINYSRLLTGYDEYGLGQLGLGILFIIGHIIIGFVHRLFITLKRKQTQ